MTDKTAKKVKSKKANTRFGWLPGQIEVVKPTPNKSKSS